MLILLFTNITKKLNHQFLVDSSMANSMLVSRNTIKLNPIFVDFPSLSDI